MKLALRQMMVARRHLRNRAVILWRDSVISDTASQACGVAPSSQKFHHRLVAPLRHLTLRARHLRYGSVILRRRSASLFLDGNRPFWRKGASRRPKIVRVSGFSGFSLTGRSRFVVESLEWHESEVAVSEDLR